MKNLEIIKKYAFAIAAIAMAVGFSAFKMNESKTFNTVTIHAVDDLHWYVRDNQGNYAEFTPSTEEEKIEDICPESGPQICALGFETEMDPNELSDADAPNATAQFTKPLN